MMGKFSGCLICTDFDGTFATGGEPVPENLEAVSYFVKNGGRFTVATGRSVDFIREKGLQDIINAPACLCNGSVVYDYRADRLLRQWNLAFAWEEFLDCIAPVKDLIASVYVFESVTRSVQYEDYSSARLAQGSLKPLKLLCKFATIEQADKFRDFAQEQPLFSKSHISKSFRVGVEFNSQNGTKGSALDYIRDYLGDIHTTVGVGDYDNDIPLLTHADIAATPSSGLELLQQHAHWILKPCTEGAIRDLIERLEREI